MSAEAIAVAKKREIVRGIVLTLVINGLLPLLVYNLLEYEGVASVTALIIATLIPLADNLITLLKHRRLDVFGAFMLFGFLLGLGTVLLGGSEKLILVRESFATGLVGCVFLGSMLFKRPLIFYFAMRFSVGKSQAEQEAFAAKWAHPYFRFVMRLMTTVWGLVLVGEAVLRVILAFQLTVSQFMAVSNVMGLVVLGGTVLWTVAYRRHSTKKFAKMDPVRV